MPATVLKVWWSLSKADWLEAFRAHPRIGDAVALRKVSEKPLLRARGSESHSKCLSEQILLDWM